MQSGDLFRYTAAKDAPVSLLEVEFAQMMGSEYALAVSSCIFLFREEMYLLIFIPRTFRGHTRSRVEYKHRTPDYCSICMWIFIF